MSKKQNIDIEKIKKHWVDSSDKDYQTMITLFNSKDYNWALFIGHIVIERLLKAYYVQIKNDHAPFTHDLLRLVQMSELEIDNEKADWILLLHLILMPDMITIIRNFIKNVHMNLLNIG